MKSKVQKIRREVQRIIANATPAMLAGLNSGAISIYLDDHLNVELGCTPDLGHELFIGGGDCAGTSDDLKILQQAVSIVGMPDDYEDIEELGQFGPDDDVRAKAFAADPTLAARVRAELLREADHATDQIDYILTGIALRKEERRAFVAYEN